MDTGKEGKQLSKTLDAFYMDGAVKIAKYIRMNDYKKNRMANAVSYTHLDVYKRQVRYLEMPMLRKEYVRQYCQGS